MSTLRTINIQHLNASSPAVTLDANGNMTVAGTVVGGTPLSGMRNRIINGDMRIDQRNAGASVSSIYGYGVDRWAGYYLGSGTGRFSAQQSSTAPTGFKNSWLLTVTTADAAPSSGYGYGITHTIEGYNVADLNWGTANASTITMSFWVRSSVTGTFPLCIGNGTSYRVYGSTYTINSANTWEYKTVTIPGDTTGTWATDNTSGFYIVFGFGGGSTRTFNAGWQSGSGSTPTNVTGCTQIIATNGATFYLTGAQLEAGSVATPFERRLYGTELALCQRYFYMHARGHSTNDVILFYGMGWSTSQLEGTIRLPVTMRIVPVVVASSVSAEFQIQTNSFTTTTTGPSLNNWGQSTDTPMIYVTGLPGMTNGGMYRVSIVGGKTSSYLGFNAEL